MKTLILIFCLLISHEIYSQTFKVSNIVMYGYDAEKIQRTKQKMLGTKVEMKFYDESVKITTYDLDGEKEKELVLDKDKNLKNSYTFKDSKGTVVTLTLETLASYITSATIKEEEKKDYYGHYSKAFIATLKRD